MGKSSKKATATSNKPITDFFQPKSSQAPSSSQQTATGSKTTNGQSEKASTTKSSSQTGECAKKSGKDRIGNKSFPGTQELAKTKGKGELNSTSDCPGNEDSTDLLSSASTAIALTKARRNVTKPAPPNSSPIMTRSRSKTPDIAHLTRSRQSGSKATQLAPVTEGSHRTRKRALSPDIPESPSPSRASSLASSSVVSFGANVNYSWASSTGSSASHKRPRLSSPDDEIIPDSDELVPDSQGEEELNSMAMQSMSSALPQAHDEEAMEVDDYGLPSPVSPARHGSQNSQLSEDEIIFAPLTPPQTDPPLLPVTPDALIHASPTLLTQSQKTAKTIADIKARAAAKALASPELSPSGVEFKYDLSDSEDEEEDLLQWSRIRASEKAKSKATTPMTQKNAASPSTPATSGRYSLRSADGPSTSAKVSPQEPKASSARSKKPAKKSLDPIDELLAEKARADKARAKRVMDTDSRRPLAPRTPVRGGRDPDEADMDLLDEQDVSFSMTEGDQMRLFGEKEGNAIRGILESDKQRRGKTGLEEKSFGVPFWVPETDGGDIFMDPPMEPLKALSDGGGNIVLQMLKTSVEQQNLDQAVAILDSGVLLNMTLPKVPHVVTWLCDLALATNTHALTASAFRCLLSMWSSPQSNLPGLALPRLVQVLAKLGAKPSVLESMGWTVDLGYETLESTRRPLHLNRLLLLIEACARSGSVKSDEIPDFILALLLVGLDSRSSSAVLTSVMSCIDAICASLADGSTVEPNLEAAICSKILKFTSPLEPVNQAHVVSLMQGGSVRALRIAQWVAHSLLTGVVELKPDNYCELPPLSPILDELSKRSTPERARTFQVGPDTDYLDMVFRVSILSAATSNVPGYAKEERSRAAEQSAEIIGSDKPLEGKFESKPPTQLESLVEAIEFMHASINDTRAAHLDRSRFKAQLKQVSLRIHYQATTALRSGKRAPKRDIHTYFNNT